MPGAVAPSASPTSRYCLYRKVMRLSFQDIRLSWLSKTLFFVAFKNFLPVTIVLCFCSDSHSQNAFVNYVTRCPSSPSFHLHSLRPVSVQLSRLSLLIIRLRNFNCLFRIENISFLVSHMFCPIAFLFVGTICRFKSIGNCLLFTAIQDIRYCRQHFSTFVFLLMFSYVLFSYFTFSSLRLCHIFCCLLIIHYFLMPLIAQYKIQKLLKVNELMNELCVL